MAPKKPRPRIARPHDRTWVSTTMRKRGSTAIKKNHQFGKDCNTIAVLLFYNKIHGFWDGSGHVPEGESLPDNMNEVIEDIMRRQVISDGELILRPARERKQSIKTRPTKVTKPAPAPAPARSRNLRSLRNRKQQLEDGPPMSSASPSLTQIMVAGSEIGADDRDTSIWDMQSTPPAKAMIEVQGDDNLSEDDRSIGTADAHDEVYGDDGADDPGAGDGGDDVSDDDERIGGNIENSNRLMESGALAPHRNRADLQHREVAPSPSTTDRDAEGELCGWLDEPLVPVGSWTNDVVVISEPVNEPAPVDFTTMMADDAWMPSAVMSFGDAPGLVDTSEFPSMLDVDFGNMDLDIDVNVNGMDWFEQFSVPPATEIVPAESTPTEIMPPNLMDISSAVAAPQIRAAPPDAESRMLGASQRATAEEVSPILGPTLPTSARRSAPLSKLPVTAEKDWQQPIYVTGSQLLAVITQSLHMMNGNKDTEWDSSSGKDVGWSMRDHHGFDTPLATPVC